MGVAVIEVFPRLIPLLYSSASFPFLIFWPLPSISLNFETHFSLSLSRNTMVEAPTNFSQTTDVVGSGSVTSPPSAVLAAPVGSVPEVAATGILPQPSEMAPILPPPPPSSTTVPTPAATPSPEVTLAALKIPKKRKGAEPSSNPKPLKGRKTTEGSRVEKKKIACRTTRIPGPALNIGEVATLPSLDVAASKGITMSFPEDPAQESSMSGSESSDSDFRATKRRSARSSVDPSPADLKSKSAGSSKSTSKKTAPVSLKSSVSKAKRKSSGAKDTKAPLPPKKRALEVIPIPPLAHFVDSAARTLFASCTMSRPVVYEKAIDFSTLMPMVKIFVAQLGWVKALESFPPVNLTLVHEFYANFPEDIPVEVKLRTRDPIHVFVRGIQVDISPSNIRQVLSLPQTDKGVMSRVKTFISEASLDTLATNFYSTAPTEPFTECYLSSQYMTEWYKTMGFLARTMLTPTTQTSKIPHHQAALIDYFCTKGHPILPAEYYMFQAIRKAAVPQRHAIKSSLVFPSLITLLCVAAGVQVWDKDMILPPIPPVDRLTIAKSSAQSHFYVETLEHTLLKRDIKKSLDQAFAAALTDVKASISDQLADLKTTLTGMLDKLARPTPARARTKRTTPDSESSAGDTIKEDTPILEDTLVDDAAREGESSDEPISAGATNQDDDADLDDVAADSV